MKKAVSCLVLVLSCLVSTAQIQEKRIFDYVISVAEDGATTEKAATNIMYFNYRGENVVKVYLANGSMMYFDRVTTPFKGETVSGYGFTEADYTERDSKMPCTIQVFDDTKFGVRFISDIINLQFL